MSQYLAYLYLRLGYQPLSFLVRFGFSGNTHINGIGLGISGNGGIVAVQKCIQSFFYGGFAQTGDAENASENQATCIWFKSGNSFLFPHTIHFSRYTGHGNNNMLIFFDPPARGGATRIRESLCGGNQGSLLDVALWHVSMASSKKGS